MTVQPNKQQLGTAKRIMSTFFGDNPQMFRSSIDTLKDFDGVTEFCQIVGEKDGFIAYHPRYPHQQKGELRFTIRASVVDWWHTALQPQLKDKPRRSDGVMLLAIYVEVRYLDFSTKEVTEAADYILYHGDMSGDFNTNTSWRFIPFLERNHARGEFKGGHPRHFVDDVGNVSLSPRYAYGRLGNCTWGTTRTDRDGETRIERGIWYSSMSAQDWMNLLPSTPKQVEDELRYHFRPHWFVKRPMPVLDTDLAELPDRVTDNLGRKHQAYVDRFEGVYVSHDTVQQVWFSDTENKETA